MIMRNRSQAFILALCMYSIATWAQEPEQRHILELGQQQTLEQNQATQLNQAPTQSQAPGQKRDLSTSSQSQGLFNHLDFSVTLGTTGIGIEAAMPVTAWGRVRTGMSYVPKIEVPMTFGIQIGEDATTSQSKFERLSGMLSSFTGKPVSDEVKMTGRPTFWNWNVLVDFFPLKSNRHWHVTGGFYLGPTKVAEAYNQTESMSSLLSVSIYNNMYDKLHGKTRRQLAGTTIIEIPGMELGNDLETLVMLQEKLDNYGRMGMHLGYYSHDIVDDDGNIIHKIGDAYMMDPDDDSMVKADMKVNAFKPYVGIGYDGRLSKNDHRLYVGFDAGVMFWGGTPHLTTHDGTDLIHDITGVPGKVGDYVSTMKQFKVFPMINAKITYRLF